RIEVGSSVVLIAASTLARLGVWPDLQTEAIASSMTCVAANTGGPNVPKFPYFAFAVAAISWSAGIPVMSGPNEDTYEPLIENVPGENSPSVPKITAFLCCAARLRPNCWALAATCHGSTTTEVDGVTLATSEEKSVVFWDTDSWSTLIPAALNTGVMAATRPVEYDSWSSTIIRALGCRLSTMEWASCGPCTPSLVTTRKNVGYFPVVRVA